MIDLLSGIRYNIYNYLCFNHFKQLFGFQRAESRKRDHLFQLCNILIKQKIVKIKSILFSCQYSQNLVPARVSGAIPRELLYVYTLKISEFKVQEYAFWEWLKGVIGWWIQTDLQTCFEVHAGWVSHGSGHRTETHKHLVYCGLNIIAVQILINSKIVIWLYQLYKYNLIVNLKREWWYLFFCKHYFFNNVIHTYIKWKLSF